jgi:hypothetical protein
LTSFPEKFLESGIYNAPIMLSWDLGHQAGQKVELKQAQGDPG